MSNEKKIVELLDGFADARIGRREFVARALALGVGVSAIGAVLSACGGGEAPKEGAPDAGAPVPATPPTQAELGPVEGELHIYNWSDYIAEDTVAGFNKEFPNVKVTYDTFESNEEMIAKLQAGAGGYDLVCPSGYAVTVLRNLDLIDKLHKKHLPNLANVAPMFQNTVFDPASEYTVPWQWGVTGIAYRKDKVKAAPDSWAVFHDAALKGKMTMMDDMRDVIGAWLKFRGKSLNSTVAEDLAVAKADALLAKPNLKSFISAAVKAQLIAGDVWVAQMWNGDSAQAKVENAEIAFVLPKEGGSIWTDSMVIPKAAKNKRAAHEFLNFVMRPDVAAAISNFTGYGTPNQAALAQLTTPVPYPTDEQMKVLEYQQDLGEHTATWDQVWTEIKSA